MKMLLLGLLLIGVSLWDIYEGTTSFIFSPFFFGRTWWRYEHPIIFWICVGIEFLLGLFVIGFQLVSWVAK